jgi:hypothetical protein
MKLSEAKVIADKYEEGDLFKLIGIEFVHPTKGNL